MIYVDPKPISDQEMEKIFGHGLWTPGDIFLGPSKEKVGDYAVAIAAAIVGAAIPAQ